MGLAALIGGKHVRNGMKRELERFLGLLETSRDAHLEVGMCMHKAYGGAIYPLDLLASAVLKRSMALIDGFSAMIRAENFICAAPLVRLQLDNLLRFSASWMVEKPHDLVLC